MLGRGSEETDDTINPNSSRSTSRERERERERDRETKDDFKKHLVIGVDIVLFFVYHKHC